MSTLSGDRPLDPAAEAGWGEARQTRKGFFTDTSICIGCKACEVACKEWNAIPEDGGLALSGMSYDNTVGLSADTWRHVAFIEQQKPLGHQQPGLQRARDEGVGFCLTRPTRGVHQILVLSGVLEVVELKQ